MQIRQLLVDAHRCAGPLDDADTLAGAVDDAARSVGATIVERARARYVPHGVTVVAILAESHVVLSTWPEHRLALVDILLCNGVMDPREAWEVLAAVLQPSEIVATEAARGLVPSTPKPAVG
ncbi:MAG: adenosylmethionine decarboxylase [Deltaproteobacteria bacterium]|nr:adenosylmethionine decarboxylase [Deltaproteobacteria bacterium]